jgi:hypothetical protein
MTSGWILLKASAHACPRLTMVSDPFIWIDLLTPVEMRYPTVRTVSRRAKNIRKHILMDVFGL